MVRNRRGHFEITDEELFWDVDGNAAGAAWPDEPVELAIDDGDATVDAEALPAAADEVASLGGTEHPAGELGLIDDLPSWIEDADDEAATAATRSLPLSHSNGSRRTRTGRRPRTGTLAGLGAVLAFVAVAGVIVRVVSGRVEHRLVTDAPRVAATSPRLAAASTKPAIVLAPGKSKHRDRGSATPRPPRAQRRRAQHAATPRGGARQPRGAHRAGRAKARRHAPTHSAARPRAQTPIARPAPASGPSGASPAPRTAVPTASRPAARPKTDPAAAFDQEFGP